LGAASYQEPGTWTGSFSHRWQYSDRHYVGDAEQTHRNAENSEVINDVQVIDISVGYAITKRVNAILSIPFQFASRRSSIRDPRQPDNKFGNSPVIDHYWTEANGLSDIKLLATVWLLDPDYAKKGNVSLGVGVKFPTGEKDAKDEFLEFDTDEDGNYSPRAETRNVDNSIQPGDGAWGFIADIYGFREVVENFNVFASGTYIFEPETDAGVVSGNLQTSTTIWSVADTYLARFGFGYTFWPEQGLTFTLNGRVEGTPPTDAMGSSEGRRRPGFAISIEPGFVFVKNRWFASFSAPIALYRNRQRNFEGESGDAAFADFITLFSVGRTF
jgi:hypothetical protein